MTCSGFEPTIPISRVHGPAAAPWGRWSILAVSYYMNYSSFCAGTLETLSFTDMAVCIFCPETIADIAEYNK